VAGPGTPASSPTARTSEDGFFFSGVPTKFKQIALAKLEPAAALEPKLVRSPPVRNKERQA
jgi:hypothetical protein